MTLPAGFTASDDDEVAGVLDKGGVQNLFQAEDLAVAAQAVGVERVRPAIAIGGG